MKTVEAEIIHNTLKFKDRLPVIRRSQPVEVVITRWDTNSAIHEVEFSQFQVQKYAGGWKADTQATEDWHKMRGKSFVLRKANRPKRLSARSKKPPTGNRRIAFTVSLGTKDVKVGVDPVWQERP